VARSIAMTPLQSSEKKFTLLSAVCENDLTFTSSEEHPKKGKTNRKVGTFSSCSYKKERKCQKKNVVSTGARLTHLQGW
jgi:hypothetical protein